MAVIFNFTRGPDPESQLIASSLGSFGWGWGFWSSCVPRTPISCCFCVAGDYYQDLLEVCSLPDMHGDFPRVPHQNSPPPAPTAMAQCTVRRARTSFCRTKSQPCLAKPRHLVMWASGSASRLLRGNHLQGTWGAEGRQIHTHAVFFLLLPLDIVASASRYSGATRRGSVGNGRMIPRL